MTFKKQTLFFNQYTQFPLFIPYHVRTHAWAFVNANQTLFFRRNDCFLVEQKDWKRGMPFLAIYGNKKQQNEMRKKSTQRNLQKLSSKF